MSEPDVVVIGSGIAGLSAALAASAAGARVVVIEGGAGASALAGGAWDVASASVEHRAPRALDRALDDVAGAHPAHPWARLPRALVREAITTSHELVLSALGIYRSLETSPDARWIVSELGLARATASAQTNVLDLAPLPHARVAVASLPALRGFDARFIAASLGEQALRTGDARRYVAIEVELLRRRDDATLLPHEVAALFDTPEARARAITALVRAIGGTSIDAVLVPPILGLLDGGVVPTMIAAVGVPVGEAIESLAGAQSLRLARRIAAALDARGIERRPSRARTVETTAEGVRVALSDGRELRPSALVLATGKHVGGGITVERGEPRESLAGLPIWSAGKPFVSSDRARGPETLFGASPFAPGAGFALGVGWDELLHPRDVHGHPVSRDLFACGALLEGTSPGDGTGLGLAAATGWIAGRNAAARAAR